MVFFRSHPLAAALLLGIGLALSSAPQAGEPPPDATLQSLRHWLGRLQSGGYILYARHMATRQDVEDRVPVDLDQCQTQRPLSDLGRQQARNVGQAMARWQIPIAETLSSPYCRCMDTARLAFTNVRREASLAFAFDLAPAERPTRVAALQAMLREPPPRGTNRVLVSHTANLQEAMGVWPKPEGVIYLIVPERDGPRVVLRIAPELWEQLNAGGP